MHRQLVSSVQLVRSCVGKRLGARRFCSIPSKKVPKYRYPVGVSDFKKLRLSVDDRNIPYFWFDNSMLIREFYRGPEAVLICRPRRWSKSLNISMLRYFFDCSVDPAEAKEMFKGTKIWKHQEFIKKYMNQYPVIQLDFSEIGFQNLDWKLVEDQFVDIMQVALEPHQEHVSEGVFSHMIERTSKVTALKDISKSLKHHHAKNPRKNGAIILIDEYDSAVNKAYNNEDFRDEKAKRRFINSLQEYTSTLLESGLKSNVWLEKGLMTGIIRLGKTTILSRLNNVVKHSMGHPRFCEFYGVREQSVKAAISDVDGLKVDVNASLKTTKNWYDGYNALANGGNPVRLYNPYSIIHYFDQKTPQAYWVQTGEDAHIGELVRKLPVELQEHLMQMVSNSESTITLPLRKIEEITYPKAVNTKERVLSYMYHTGYLTTTPSTTGKCDSIQLEVPNFEVATCLRDAWYLTTNPDVKEPIMKALEALLNGEVGEAQEFMESALKPMLRAGNLSNDRSYHTLFGGLWLAFSGQRVAVDFTRDLNCGSRRPDVLVEACDDKPSVLIEFGVLDSKSAPIGDSAKIPGMTKLLDEKWNQVKDYQDCVGNLPYHMYAIVFYQDRLLLKHGNFTSRK